jgi:hypothetical protein
VEVVAIVVLLVTTAILLAVVVLQRENLYKTDKLLTLQSEVIDEYRNALNIGEQLVRAQKAIIGAQGAKLHGSHLTEAERWALQQQAQDLLDVTEGRKVN